jgi:hypothetical protein
MANLILLSGIGAKRRAPYILSLKAEVLRRVSIMVILDTYSREYDEAVGDKKPALRRRRGRGDHPQGREGEIRANVL